MTDRSPPHNVEAEMTVLGACLTDSDAADECVEFLTPMDFHKKSHALIFDSICSLSNKCAGVNYVTVSEDLNQKGVSEELGGLDYLFALSDAVISTAVLKSEIKIVKALANARNVIELCIKITEMAYETRDGNGVLEEAQKAVMDLGMEGETSNLITFADATKQALAQIEACREKGGEVTGVPSGIVELDYLTTGFHDCDLVIIAGRPGMGKSGLALTMARNAARRGYKIGKFSLEMSSTQIAMRGMAMGANLDLQKMRRGKISDTEWSRVAESTVDIPIWLDDTAALTTVALRNRARRMHRQYGIQMLIVDYLQLMHSVGRRENRQVEVSDISASLKAIAKELRIPVIALSQLSRESERRGGDRHPMLSDLRDSGALEQDADVVIFVHRPGVYNKSVELSVAELIVAKQRMGPVGTVNATFRLETTEFSDMDTTHEEANGRVKAYNPADEDDIPF